VICLLVGAHRLLVFPLFLAWATTGNCQHETPRQRHSAVLGRGHFSEHGCFAARSSAAQSGFVGYLHRLGNAPCEVLLLSAVYDMHMSHCSATYRPSTISPSLPQSPRKMYHSQFPTRFIRTVFNHFAIGVRTTVATESAPVTTSPNIVSNGSDAGI
jgi:hypothetical protein